MKNLLLIALTLASVSAFAEHHEGASKDAHKAAMEACKEHSKDKKAMEACIAEHSKAAMATTTTTTTTKEAAPAAKK